MQPILICCVSWPTPSCNFAAVYYDLSFLQNAIYSYLTVTCLSKQSHSDSERVWTPPSKLKAVSPEGAGTWRSERPVWGLLRSFRLVLPGNFVTCDVKNCAHFLCPKMALIVPAASNALVPALTAVSSAVAPYAARYAGRAVQNVALNAGSALIQRAASGAIKRARDVMPSFMPRPAPRPVPTVTHPPHSDPVHPSAAIQRRYGGVSYRSSRLSDRDTRRYRLRYRLRRRRRNVLRRRYYY